MQFRMLVLLALLLAACPGDDDDAVYDDDDVVDDDDSSEECVDDPLEDNDVLLASTQVALVEGVTLVACPEDEDWFTFEVVGSRIVSVELSATPTDAGLAMRLDDAYGNALGQGAVGQEIETQVEGDDNYFLAIWLDNGEATSATYTFTVSTEDPP